MKLAVLVSVASLFLVPVNAENEPIRMALDGAESLRLDDSLNALDKILEENDAKNDRDHGIEAFDDKVKAEIDQNAEEAKDENRVVPPIVVVQKMELVEPDKDESDQGALAKEVEKLQKEKQSEGDAILSGRTDADGKMLLLIHKDEEAVNIEDLTSAKKERLMSGEFLLICFLVLVSWAITQTAVAYKIYAVQMPLVCTLVGLFVGILLNVTHVSDFLGYLEFSDDIFFMMLLPPIIFDSGFNLNVKELHNNATSIFYFAFLGTFLSFIISSVGFGLIFSILPFSSDVQVTPSGILSYGALISATDPVSVIALFKELPVAVSLQSIVTGESLMNDAISISLYRTFSTIDSSGILDPIFSFFIMFIGSVVVGTVTGWNTALLFKYCTVLNSEIRISTMLMFSYIAYLLAEFVGCSGIVAILFCGISQSMYTLPNVDSLTSRSFRVMIASLSHLAESIAFIYLGMAVCFLKVEIGDAIAAVVVTLIVVTISRIAAIQLTADCLLKLHNISISPNFNSALSLCGLRGAVAFGLAKHARHDYGHGLGSLILAGTLGYALFTVIIVGPIIPTGLEYLGLSSAKDDKVSYSDSPTRSNSRQDYELAGSKTVVDNRIINIIKFIDLKLSMFLLSSSAIDDMRSSESESPAQKGVHEIEFGSGSHIIA